VPIGETLGALNELVKAGKVREIGSSNFSAGQLREAEEAAARSGGARFVSVQNEYSLLHREPEAEVIPYCVRTGIAFLPYFPLANGLLSGKYRLGRPVPKGSRADDAFGPKVFTEQNLKIVESLIEFAAARGHTLLELAISWLATRPAVASVIAGARTPEQVRANALAASWQLTDADAQEIDKIVLQTA
jgi:aryl-alcohol dehydrogenase-like predicted oxidoreductase